METVSTGSPERSKAAGLPASQIPDSFRTIYREVTDQGAGPHTLTGPVFIEEAEPGHALEVQRFAKSKWIIRSPATPFAPEPASCRTIPFTRIKIIPLDRARQVAHFADGIFGSIGAAPPDVTETRASMP